MVKLNLGAGETALEGYEARDGKKGDVLYPLPDGDNSVDEIRASHVLEHFPHGQVAAVLRDWVRALKPGGVLKIAVPDFKVVSEQYLAGADIDVQGYVMGGQTGARDFHGALFDREMLIEALHAVGLIAVRDWKSEIRDCAALPISLNLAGTKRGGPAPRISALISMPRLGFNDFWGCVQDYLQTRGIQLRRSMGVYWDRKLTHVMENALAEDAPEWILTLDYDTIFTAEQLDALIDLARRHPEADAIAPLQASRHRTQPMLTVLDDEGNVRTGIEREKLNVELLRTRTAHFGCTLIRAERLRALPKPWLWSQPDAKGEWGEGAIDADVWFWRQWEKAGFSLYSAMRVPVGHVDMAIRWPDINLEAIWQLPYEFLDAGVPDNIWR
jgi:SAM-dependent methyltransferase